MWRAVAIVVAVVAAGCSTVPSRAVTTPPAPQPPPERIVLIGDSLMLEVAAAVEAATTGRATVEYVLTIGTAEVADDWWDVWTPVIDRVRPDAVAVFVGPWEINRPDLGTPGWASWYGGRLDRWADLLTARGADLYWIRSLTARAPEIDDHLAIVSDAYTELAARRDDVTLVDAADALGSRRYLEHTATGERLRRTDGLHLCPAGVARIAGALLDAFGLSPVAPWPSGAWASREPAYSPVECPSGGTSPPTPS